MANRTWTPKKKAKVIAYCNIHGHSETLRRFRISGSMLNRWQHEPGAKVFSEVKPNGLDVLTKAEERLQEVTRAINVVRLFVERGR